MFQDTLIKKSFTLAVERHAGQTYGNAKFPFMLHLWNVAGVAHQFFFDQIGHDNYDPEIVAACWLHDIIEDTDMTYSILKKITTHRVAELVYACTDELGRDRAQRKRKTYKKLVDNEDGMVVKLCDRIANVDFTINTENTNGIWAMYKKEHSEFVNMLFNAEHKKCSKLWQRLDKLMQRGIK